MRSAEDSKIICPAERVLFVELYLVANGIERGADEHCGEDIVD